MNSKDPARVLDEISREHLPAGLNLLPGTVARINLAKQVTRKPVTKFHFAAMLLVLFLVVIFFSRPGVAAALKKLIGYIPGVGEVDQSAPLRVLAAPVSDERDGYSLTVESAVLDSTRTVLNFSILGAFPTWEDPARKPRACPEFPSLRLADGKVLANQSSEWGLGGGKAQWQVIFPPVPTGVDSAVLVLPCLPDLPAGQGPRGWEVPLAFAPAPPEMTVYPVAALPTALAPSQAAPADNAEPFHFTLQGVAAVQDGYYLQTRLSWPAGADFSGVEIYPDAVHLFDPAEAEVALWPADQNPPFALAEDQAIDLNFQTGPISTGGPLRLELKSLGLRAPASARFTFDAGDSPTPGQTWPLDIDLEVNGQRLRVRTAEYTQAAPGEPAMLLLHLEANADVLMVTALDPEHEINGTGGSPNNSPLTPFRTGWYYRDGFPSGKITVEITGITVRRNGPWSIEWTPAPTGPASTLPATAATAAFSGAETRPAASASAPALSQEPARCAGALPAQASLPAGLGGRTAALERTGETVTGVVSNLDGSSRAELGYVTFPDLSPDGSRVAYLGTDDGLHIRDLSTGSDLLIPGTTQENVLETWPKWSPDGQQIAFDRVVDLSGDISVVDVDGGEPRALVGGPADERLLGWSPDSQRISYTTAAPEGFIIRVLEVESDHTFEAGRIHAGAINHSLSADGKRLLYTDEQGLHLVELAEGSAPVLLLSAEPPFGHQIHPIWSPDGKWIALNYWESPDKTTPKLALLHADTCQVVEIEGQKAGWLFSWVRK